MKSSVNLDMFLIWKSQRGMKSIISGTVLLVMALSPQECVGVDQPQMLFQMSVAANSIDDAKNTAAKALRGFVQDFTNTVVTAAAVPSAAPTVSDVPTTEKGRSAVLGSLAPVVSVTATPSAKAALTQSVAPTVSDIPTPGGRNSNLGSAMLTMSDAPSMAPTLVPTSRSKQPILLPTSLAPTLVPTIRSKPPTVSPTSLAKQKYSLSASNDQGSQNVDVSINADSSTPSPAY
jgi:hypothetical protein